MYNDIIMIVLCVFAVYGAYALFKEIFMLFYRDHSVVVAVRVDNSLYEDNIVLAEKCIADNCLLEKYPVLLCVDTVPEDLSKYGYEIYVKYTEEK